MKILGFLLLMCTCAGLMHAQTPTLKADTIMAVLDQHPALSKLNQPLCFVNGKKFSIDSLNTINPSTIESIDVVNRTDASKKYGEAGKNGAILIKLKDIVRPKED